MEDKYHLKFNTDALVTVYDYLYHGDYLEQTPTGAEAGFALYNLLKSLECYELASEMRGEALRFCREFFQDHECFPVDTWQGKIFMEDLQ